jgi:D-alanyl-lipoteichoic acid acyltransferase DltB (MBOAT superfamily)
MLGLILLLHFGIFHIVGLAWQSLGIAAEPIMRAPLRSQSLSEFWGKRWNLGFRQLSHSFIFVPLHRRLGTGYAGFLVFVISGLLHDLIISVPSRGGYGLPTLYFAIQGGAIVLERSNAGRRFGLGRGKRGWLFMAAITAGPAFWLFHPPFVHNVILPFMKAIGALR